jgi:hypothetical protein
MFIKYTKSPKKRNADSSTEEHNNNLISKFSLSAKSIKISKNPFARKRKLFNQRHSEASQPLCSNENSDFNLQSTQILSQNYSFCQRQRALALPSDLDFFQTFSNTQDLTEDQRSTNEEEEASERVDDILSLASKDSRSIGFALAEESNTTHDPEGFELRNRKEYDITSCSYPAHISKKMRAIVVDWIMEVCSDLKFERETFFCAVDYLDRVIIRSAGQGISKENLQLFGVTCLLISAKKEVA